MQNCKTLMILQYNVWGSKAVVIPLLADRRIHEYDIIAIQEPWQNPHMPATYCPASAPFTPAYPPRQGGACLLINRHLDTSRWLVTFPDKNLTTLRLDTEMGRIWIHNIYSRPPGAYNTTRYDTPIPKLRKALSEEGEHILLGDFNLHHPRWSGIGDPTHHDMADTLVEIYQRRGLDLCLPPGTTTWNRDGYKSTIDLVFATELVQQRITECQARPDLGHGFDHHPISTVLDIEPSRPPERIKRSWKRMDKTEWVREPPTLSHRVHFKRLRTSNDTWSTSATSPAISFTKQFRSRSHPKESHRGGHQRLKN